MKRRQPDAPATPTIAEFSWDISRFRNAVLNPAGAFQNKPAFKEKLVRTKAGDIELRAEEPRLKLEVLFRKDHGFLPCRMAAAGPMDEKVVQEEICDWKRHNEGWFPQRLIRTFRPKNRPGDRAVPPYRCTLELTDVKLDVTPDDSEFTQAALELAAGARILDRRPK